MKLLAELGKGKSLDDFAMIDNKNEDWKYIKFPEDINNFKISKGESSNSSQKAHIVIRDNNYEVLKEHNDFEIINANSFSKVVIDDYSNRPLDRFVLQQKDKSTSGLVIRTINSSKEPLDIEIQSSGTNVPYIGVIAEKNITSSIKFLFTETSKGSSYPLIDYKLNSNSQIDTYIVHNTPKSSSSVTSFYAQIGKDASLNMHCVSFGSNLSRIRFDIDLDGVGSNFNIEGVYFGDEDGLVDYRVFVNHNVKNTSSNMLLKGALVDQSNSVFTGTIHIAEGAEKTVSHQINRNLILDKRAKAHSVPNLEILCDDVICGHGSSVGPIEEDLFHYVMSRGISKIEAEKLLIKGFFNEVLNRDKWKNLREDVLQNIQTKYENSLGGIE
tara:strand:+ start:386 stop:1537 length:1152 start_codon:yes stop_codon:yes gene_type:complete